VLVWVSLGSFAGAGFLLARGRGGIGVLLLGALGLASGWFAWQTAQLERRLSDAAELVSGRPGVSVDCRNLVREMVSGRPGEVWFDADGTPAKVTTLSWEICGDLDGWLDGGSGVPSTDEMIAVHVLTHEAIHLAGHRDEAYTECLAMQYDEATAILLGADPTTARQLAERYWLEVYPRMRGDYTHANCGPGRPWDRTPSDGRWPGGLGVPTGPGER
jgi:hypothetical protein